MSELNARQALFVKEYLVDLNATQAAIKAGYAAKGAEVTASKLLRNPKVSAVIQQQKAKRNDALELDAVRVLEEIACIALSNHQNYQVDAYGQLNASEKDMRAVKKFRRRMIVDADGNVTGVDSEVELWDKPKALELLGKHMGLWGDKNQSTDSSAMELFLKLYEQALARRNQNVIGN